MILDSRRQVLPRVIVYHKIFGNETDDDGFSSLILLKTVL